jgi:predicted TIM-barrel fold metal-dependent hydrolase
MQPYVRRVYDVFGPRRMFWGSDLSRLPCTYRQMITMFTEEMTWIPPADLEWIMGRGLCEWLAWPG